MEPPLRAAVCSRGGASMARQRRLQQRCVQGRLGGELWGGASMAFVEADTSPVVRQRAPRLSIRWHARESSMAMRHGGELRGRPGLNTQASFVAGQGSTRSRPCVWVYLARFIINRLSASHRYPRLLTPLVM
jgi:hypothetical protein